jgi:DNA-binding phage protein
MTLTRDFRQTVVERVQRDPAFAKALLDEAATLFLSGEPDSARLILRDLVNATVGFEGLAELTSKPSKSLHRMLSPKGNPSMDNLAAIFDAAGHAALKGSMRTTARAPTALAKRWTVRMDGVPLPLSMRAITLWVVPMRAATSPCVRPAFIRAAIGSRASSNSGA